MEIKPLVIGNIKIPFPIVQGGMGVGISLSGLASAVTNAGGLGVISSAQIGYREKGFFDNAKKCNLKALKDEIKLAKKKTNNGPIGVNIMVATRDYEDYVKTAIEAGIDIIVSGAGLPTMLPKIVKGTKVKIAPIVSSLKAAKVLLKLWDKHDNVTADMVVIEGPKAGGHLGFHKENLEEETKNFSKIVEQIIPEVKKYEEKYDKKIPVIVGGGVFDGSDIYKYFKLGADGVQMATRFVATEECDADIKYKECYVKAKESDVVIVNSPVGMPGRAILNDFVKKTRESKIEITKCFRCLAACNPTKAPYCISKALINAVKGNVDEGLIFCGSNVDKVKEITTVNNIFSEIKDFLLKAE